MFWPNLAALTLSISFFPRLYISQEVHYEVVIAGVGLPGSTEVSKAEWIEVKTVANPAGLYSAQQKYGSGPGEMSTILLAKELGANPVLLDDYKARKVAKAEGLRSVFQELLTHNVYIDKRLLDRRLRWTSPALRCGRLDGLESLNI